MKDAVRPSVLFPLTARTKLAQEYRDKLEKAWENKEKCKTLKNQIKSVGVIKEHIAKQKQQFLCHQSERIEKQNKRRQEFQEKLLAKYNVDVPNTIKSKIADKLIKHTRAQKLKWWKRNERIKQITKKLATEIQEREKEKLRKTIKPKMKTLAPKIYNVLSHVAMSIECDENLLLEEIDEEEDKMETDENWEDIKEEETIKIQNKVIQKDNKKTKRKKSQTKNNSKIIVENTVEEIKVEPLEKIDEKKEFAYRKDYSFSAKPPTILFNDFINDTKYKQKVTVINTSSDILYCKFENIQSHNDIASEYIHIKQMPVQKHFPGTFFNFIIYFHPKNITCLEGNIIFHTRKSNGNDVKQFEIPFRCKIASAEINVTPINVVFKSIPIWEMQKTSNKLCNSINIENNLINGSVLVIRKAKDDFDETYESLNLELIIPPPSTTQQEETKMTKKGKRRKTKTHIDSINLEEENRKIAESIADTIIQECIKNTFNNFQFETNFLELQPMYNNQLKVYFNNMPFVGIYQEKYQFEFLERNENETDIIKIQDILLQAEITDKFIRTETDYIDFHICVLNSVYQQTFTVFNDENFSVKLGFQFPSKLKDYFSAYPQVLYLKAKRSETISVRFIPRKEILDMNIKYYDPYTNILNFPIRISLLSSKRINIPPTILTVYAILTEPDRVNLHLKDGTIQEEENGSPVINIGHITTHETVLIDFIIENLSSVTQEFGFLNLPQKELKMYISPTVKDLTASYSGSTHINSADITTKITCTTVHNSAGIKDNKTKPVNNLAPEKDLEDTRIFEHCSEQLEFTQKYSENLEFEAGNDTYEENMNELFIEEDEFEQEPEIVQTLKKQTKNLSILVKANVTDYLTELSHQYVIFPETPVGSNTTMDIQFSATNNSSQSDCVCGFVNKNEALNFSCHFEIFGECAEISVEPICGNLMRGQSKKLTLIAKPIIENHLLQETAKSYKLQRMQAAKKTKQKGKRDRNSINVENVVLQNFDIYAAEKELWKTMKPHTVKTMFTFIVTFDKDLNKNPEVLYLTAECKIIRPDFLTNTETQCINFGPTAVFTKPKRIIQIENISRKVITPEISLPFPAGPFSCAISRDMKLEKEHVLKIPLTFAPDKETTFKEYIEIKSVNTIERLIISGDGVLPDYEFSPKFVVSRIESTLDKYADCVFQINNKCKAPLIIHLIKFCELKGTIQKQPEIKNETSDKSQEAKHKSNVKRTDPSVKSNKSDKKQKGKEKIKKFSENLTPDEEYSIENFFTEYEGESLFKLMNTKDSEIIVEPFAKLKLKIRFEFPKPPKDNTVVLN
ncbi:hypothetical protein CBL_11762 [Carabus blaptoides fortunei]